jgi:CRISPR-associated endonuclease/helicase Cas3
MQIVVVNHSTGKAITLSVRVLDLWLPRIGPRVWAGQLSQEGLETVKNALTDVRTRQMEVSVYWAHQHQFERLFTVGSIHNLNADWARIGPPLSAAKPKAMPTHGRYIQSLAMLGGLFHDTGKASRNTQDVYFADPKTVRDAFMREEARHEVVSGALFLAFARNPDPMRWHQQRFSTVNWAALHHDWPQDPADRIVYQAIVSHHGLPTHEADYAYSLSKRTSKLAGQADISRLCEPTAVDAHWASLCQTALRNMTLDEVHASEWLSANPRAEPYVFFMTRTLVMLADAAESAFESDDDLQRSKFHDRIPYPAVTEESPLSSDVVYAKSTRHVPLTAHLTGVCTFARKAAHLLFCTDHQRVTRAPAILTDHFPQKESRFYWQTHARYQIKRAMGNSSEPVSTDRGFFGCMTSQTGSGKTQAGYLLMSTLSNDQPRFTLALGQGALAVQQGVEYRNRIGLTRGEVAVIVGERFQAQLSEALNSVENQMLADIEAFIEVLEYSHNEAHTAQNDVYRALFKSQRKQAFLNAPVTVMTIDHLIGAMNPNRGSYVPAALRVMTGDLILDEIDSFSAEALHAIARLVYLAGLSGRKVLLSSATLPPELASGMHAMYRKGYNAYQAATGAQDYRIGFFNDAPVTGYARLMDPFDLQNTPFEAQYADFHAPLSQPNATQSVRRKLKVIPVQGVAGSWGQHDDKHFYRVFAEQIAQASVSMANEHHTHIERDNYTVSFGFVRLNTVRDVIETVLALTELPSQYDGWDIKIQSLHSRMDRSVRTHIQSVLHQVLKRDTDHEWYEHFQHHHTPQHNTRTVVLVVCSPVIETGLDYDFDWAILEPASDMSIIQSVGRVLRHRYLLAPQSPNVGLLDATIQSIHKKGSTTRPPQGIERFTMRRGPGIATIHVDDLVRIPTTPGMSASKRRFGGSPVKDPFAGTVEDIYIRPLEPHDTRPTYFDRIEANARLSANPVTHADSINRQVLTQVFGKAGALGLGHFIDDPNPLVTDRFLKLHLREADGRKELYRFEPLANGGYKASATLVTGTSLELAPIKVTVDRFFIRPPKQSDYHIELSQKAPKFFSPIVGAL